MGTDPAVPAVLVTRPEGPACQDLCEALRLKGYRAFSQPLLELEAVAELDPVQRRLVAGLDRYQHVIFISTNAARFGLQWMLDAWPQLPSSVNWYAIGEATAGLLASHGINALSPGECMTSEGLLALPALNQVSDDRVLIVKGEGGRDTLRTVLSERGAQVDELACYRRKCPQLSAGRLAARLRDWQIDVILISSGAGLTNLRQLLRPAETTNLTLCLVVPSDRVARMAQEMGFVHIKIAQNASDTAMVRALEDFLPCPGDC